MSDAAPSRRRSSRLRAPRHGAAAADKNCPFSALPDECVLLVLRQLEVLQSVIFPTPLHRAETGALQ